jgi:hypothetical protein
MPPPPPPPPPPPEKLPPLPDPLEELLDGGANEPTALDEKPSAKLPIDP